jgi:NodT family efflux transporter outer membrane factor (OMF) lipoprotein
MNFKAHRLTILSVMLGRLSMLLAIAGCSSLHTPYRAPVLDVPGQFTYAEPATATIANLDGGKWWQQFGDPQLNSLIDEALQRNNGLAAKTIAVRRAQLAAGLTADAQTPQLSVEASTGVSRNLLGDPNSARSSSVNAGVSYTLDLWGHLGNVTDLRRWEALATEQDRESAVLTTIGATAGFYWKAAYLNQRIALGEQSIAYAERTLALVRVQYEAGSVSSLELLEAQRTVAAQRATQTGLRQLQVENENALAILFDGPPRTMPVAPLQLPDRPLPQLAAEVPSAVLARRPDMRAAEQRLRKTLLQVDVTRGSYYPTFSLTGGVGTGSDSLRNALQNPVASLGLGLVLPLAQWNKMQLDINISQADYEIAIVNFRQTIYSALSDVENALSARSQFAQEAVLLTESLAAARKVEHLYEIRYRAGSVALSLFLDAQDKRRATEIALATNRLNSLNNQMTLYLALGGSDAPGAPGAMQID